NAHRWVQSQLDSGRSVGIVPRNGAHQKAPASAEFEGFDPAATSFTAFLTTNSGPGALGEYLRNYDPARRDQAAITVFHEPLAVLEEQWLAKMRRRNREGNTFRSFLRHMIPLLRP